MEDRPLTEEELEAREAERVSKIAGKRSVANLLKPDLKAIRKDHTTTSPQSKPAPAAQSSPSQKTFGNTSPRGNTSAAPSGVVSPRGNSGAIPEWKRIQMEKEQMEKDRLVAEAKAREEAAKQIKARVATTGLTMNIVDEQTPSFGTTAPREVVNPNATPDFVSRPEEKRYERQESFDPRNVPDFVSRPEEKRYERQETFDPSATPNFVSKPDHDYYAPEKKFDPSSTPDYVSKPSHSYGPDTTEATPASSKYCPWCGAFAGGKFCSSCGKDTKAPASPTPAPAPAAAAPARTAAPAPRNEPFIAPASVHSKPKTYSNFAAGALAAVEGGNEFPITNFGCEVHEIKIRLIENGKRVEVSRIVMENGSERKDIQNFNLPYQVTSSTISARYNPREANGTLRVKFLRPSVNGTPALGEHEIVKFLVAGQPGSSQQRVAIGIDQTNDYYKFVPGQPSPYDTTFTVVLNGSALEFRSAFAVPEGDAIKSISGKQSVNLPKAPFLEQISTEDLGSKGKAVIVRHQVPASNGGSEQNVPEFAVNVQLV